MAKRFTDTGIWQKEWFLKLTLKQKTLLRFLFDNCDCAGVYDPNYTLLNVYIGEPVSEEEILSLNQHKKQIIKLPNGKFYLIGFIDFQYGTLSQNCKPHIPVLKSLEENNVNFERVSKGYPKGIDTLEEKEKEKDKEKDKEKKIGGVGERKKENFDNEFKTFWNAYKPVKVSDGKFVSKGSKKIALEKYQTKRAAGVTAEEILDGLEKYLAYCVANDQLSCGVEVFLNQERWRDEYDEVIESTPQCSADEEFYL